MKILTRYLLRMQVGPFLFAFAALTGIITINMLARRLADLAGKGLPPEVVWDFFILSMPATLALTFPMAVLVSVLYSFSQLAADNEITALKASGVDLKRLLLPLFGVAALIAGGMLWFSDTVLPESNHRWSRLIMDIGQKSPLFGVREQVLNRIPTSDGRTFYLKAAGVDPITNRLRDVAIYDVSQPGVSRTVYADSGLMSFNENRTDLLLTLFDGRLREVQLGQPAEFQQVEFTRQLRRIPGVANELAVGSTDSGYRGDREMTIAMMEARMDTLRGSLREARAEVYAVAREDLDALLGQPAADPGTRASRVWVDRSAGPAFAARAIHDNLNISLSRVTDLQRQIRSYRVEIQKKLSIAAATLVFVLLGAPLAIRFAQGGLGMVIFASIGIFALYYIGLIGGETLANEGYVSPVWAMWSANFLMLGVGLYLALRMGNESSSNRGGAWDERMHRLRGWLGRDRSAAP